MYTDYRNEKPKDTLLKFEKFLLVNPEIRGTDDSFIQLSMAPRRVTSSNLEEE